MRYSCEGDLGAAQEFLGKAQHELDRLERRMAIQGLEQGSFQHALSDSAYCFGYILPGGIKSIHIVAPPSVSGLLLESSTFTIPDFVSGVISGGSTTNTAPPKMTTLYPTAQSIAAHPKELAAGANNLVRLAVDPEASFDELMAPGGSPIHFSQYARLKAGMFSGRMREIVQILMGFGRQQRAVVGGRSVETSIYDGVKPLLDVEMGQSSTYTTAYQRQVSASGLQIEYDYRFPRTHGISTDAQGTLWLVEIGLNRGVVAMPLPINPYTQDPRFEQKVISVGDVDGETVLLDIGGYPTGESFPAVPATFDAYVRAGRIIRMASAADMAPFYDHTAYSQAMGWAFNRSGTEAHNTCYDFDDQGVQVGFHYAINLNVSGSADPASTTAQQELATVLRQVISGAAMLPDNADTYEAAVWKVGRLTVAQLNDWILQFGASANKQATFLDFSALVLSPLGSGSAPLTIAEQGAIWWPSKIQPQIKFADYTLGFLVSHDMRTDFRFLAVGPRCDTTMHVYFVGDELKWCKYFYDPRTSSTKVVGDSQFDIDWNPVGDFNRETTTGPFGIPAMFYTNDFDDRAEVGPSQTIERWKRRDQGWIFVAMVGPALLGPSDYSNSTGPLDPPLAPDKHVVSKYKWFTYESWADTTTAPSTIAAIAVPFFDRCAAYYATMAGHFGIQHHYGYSVGNLSSPYIGYLNADDGQPDAHDLQPETEYFAPTNPSNPYEAFQDIADEGDWVPHGEDAFSVIGGIDGFIRAQSLAYSRTTNEPTTKTLTVHLIRGRPDSQPVQTYTETRTSGDASLWDSHWFLPSPDPDTGLTDYIQAFENCYGDSDTLICMPTINAGPQLMFDGPDSPTITSDIENPNFIGVV